MIDTLPKTPRKIAKFLRSQGITGRRGSCYSCPLAIYFKQEFPYASIYGASVRVGYGAWNEPFRLPKYAIDFTKAFDRGRFRYLQEKK